MPQHLNEFIPKTASGIIMLLKSYKAERYKYKRHIFVALRS